MTPEEAIQQLEFDRAMILFDSLTGEEITPEMLKLINKENYLTYVADGIAIEALEEIQQYRKIGTVEECKKAVREEDALKFYYCESEDDYYIGKRVGNFYYARYGETGFEWFMSRYLPWGEHVIAPNTVWKEYTYPSEPKEIPFFEWLQGFIKRYCGGTVEECREAVEKQKAKKIIIESYCSTECPTCGHELSTSLGDGYYKYPTFLERCPNCGQVIQWEDLEEMKDEQP